MMDKEIKREIMLDHYNHPNNKMSVNDERYKMVHNASDSCIDDITVQSLIKDGKIEDVRFDGIACTISTASTSMMTDLVKGKSVEDARRLANKFISMIKGELVDEDELEELDEALALKNVAHMPARVKCAVLAWHTLDDALKDQK